MIKSIIIFAAVLLSKIVSLLLFLRKIFCDFFFALEGRISDKEFQNFFESFLCWFKLSFIKFDLACSFPFLVPDVTLSQYVVEMFHSDVI